MALFFLLQPVHAQMGRALVGERLVLNGSIKQVAPNRAAAKTRQAVLVRAVLPAELSDRITFEVGLAIRDLPGLQAREAAGQIFTPAELSAQHLPTQEQFDAVVDWLSSQGFTITRRDGNRLAVFASGTVAQVQQAFQTRFAQVDFQGQNYLAAVTAPSVPAALSWVIGVTGLQPFPLYRTFHNRTIIPATNNQPPYLVSEILGAFDATGTSLTGAGQEIGIVIDALPAADDLTVFWADNDVNQTLSNIFYKYTAGGPSDSTSGEETLDTEWSSTIAPSAQELIYCTGTLSGTDIDQGYSTVATDQQNGNTPNLHQLSISFGADEDAEPNDALTMDGQYFATIAGYGVTILVASGDNGAFDQEGNLSVSYPASDPNVTGVGGVSVVLNTATGSVASETGWSANGTGFNDGRIAASGGGLSRLGRPSWQVGPGVPGGSNRCVPDVAASSDQDEPGLLVFTDGGTQYAYGGANGTSWAAPTWAGLIALINQGRANLGQGPLGLLNPRIYPLVGSSSFLDITSGSNGHFGESDGYFCAPGYDLVTGIGTPLFANLLGALGGSAAPTITGFTPASGPVGQSVVITGTNFVAPLSVVFTGGVSAAGNFTATQITITVPSGAQTGPITVNTPDGSVATTSNFTVAALVPAITSATSASGTFNEAFNYQITASSAVSSYSATGLPTGLSVNTATGLISGLPAATGTFAVTLGATNANGTGSAALSLAIAPNPNAPTITAFTPANGPVGATVVITGTNFVAPLSVIFSGNVYASGNFFPTSVTVTVPLGAVSGPLTITTPNGRVTTATSFAVALSDPIITSALNISGALNQAFSYQITASSMPTSYSASGLPTGLTIDTSTGLISGVPSVTGTFPVMLGAGNATGTGYASLSLSIVTASPVITSPLAASGLTAQAFTYQISASNSPSSFGASNLPAGLSVNSGTGLISGTPTVAGVSAVTLSATNVLGTDSRILTLTIGAPGVPSITSPLTVAGAIGQSFNYQIVATNVPTAYSATGLPAGLSIDGTAGIISGTPVAVGSFTSVLQASNAFGTGTAELTIQISAFGLAVVSVVATKPEDIEGSGHHGQFTVTRIGGDESEPLVIKYVVHGSATPGVDYNFLKGTIKIMAGQTSAHITVLPRERLEPGAVRRVRLRLVPGTGYTRGQNKLAIVTLLGPP